MKFEALYIQLIASQDALYRRIITIKSYTFIALGSGIAWGIKDLNLILLLTMLLLTFSTWQIEQVALRRYRDMEGEIESLSFWLEHGQPGSDANFIRHFRYNYKHHSFIAELLNSIRFGMAFPYLCLIWLTSFFILISILDPNLTRSIYLKSNSILSTGNPNPKDLQGYNLVKPNH